MAKKNMDDLLKRRMSAAQQASELEVGNEAYETMFQAKADAAACLLYTSDAADEL